MQALPRGVMETECNTLLPDVNIACKWREGCSLCKCWRLVKPTSYSDDFSILSKNFNLKPQIANKEQRKKEDFRDFYTLKTAEIIYQRYKKDFDLWYPNAYEELIDYIKLRNISKK